MHERFGDPNFDFHVWLLDLLLSHTDPVIASQADVLEVGAGTGRLWSVNAGRVPQGWRLTLTDRSPGMLSALSELVAAGSIPASVQGADLNELPFADASFDLVFANHMLYHLPRPATGIAELRRVLRPGGLLVAATNGDGHMAQVVELARPLQALQGIQLTGVSQLSFTCENGGAQLRQEFGRVELNRRDDALEVSDGGVLMDYLRSLVHLADDAPAATVEALRLWDERLSATELPFRIDRSTGVFLAN